MSVIVIGHPHRHTVKTIYLTPSDQDIIIRTATTQPVVSVVHPNESHDSTRVFQEQHGQQVVIHSALQGGDVIMNIHGELRLLHQPHMRAQSEAARIRAQIPVVQARTALAEAHTALTQAQTSLIHAQSARNRAQMHMEIHAHGQPLAAVVVRGQPAHPAPIGLQTAVEFCQFLYDV